MSGQSAIRDPALPIWHRPREAAHMRRSSWILADSLSGSWARALKVNGRRRREAFTIMAGSVQSVELAASGIRESA